MWDVRKREKVFFRVTGKMKVLTEMGKSRRGACFGENITLALVILSLRGVYVVIGQLCILYVQGRSLGWRSKFGSLSTETGIYSNKIG